MSEQQEDRFPVVFEKYILLDRLASGGMAEIYRAWDPVMDRFCVIKRVHSQFRTNSEFMVMFKDEMRITSALDHANIIKVHNYPKSGDFIELEYVRGRTLRDIFNKARKEGKPVPQDLAIYIVAEAAAGLYQAHTHRDAEGRPLNIVHRDISPQNIMVTYDGKVKVLDFGIAKAANKIDQTRAGIVKGKFAYMSPEQLDPNLTIDHRTDIFSLGIVLWEMLTNEKLFTAKEEIQILDLIKSCNVPSPNGSNPRLSQKVCEVVLKALSKDRDHRYRDMDQFRIALSEIPARDFIGQRVADMAKNWMVQTFLKEYTEENNRIVELRKMAKQVEENLDLNSLPAPRGFTGTGAASVESKRAIGDTRGSGTLPRGRIQTHNSQPQTLPTGDVAWKPSPKVSSRPIVLAILLVAFVGLGFGAFVWLGGQVSFTASENRASNTVSLSLDGLPKSNLTILIDGQSVGESFPIAVPVNTNGVIELIVSHQGYQTYREMIEVGQEAISRTITLTALAQAVSESRQEPESNYSLLSITSNVRPDEVRVDGVLTSDPLNAVRVPRGRPFVLEVSAEGHHKRSFRISSPQDKGQLRVRLLKYDTGSINLQVKPTQARAVFRSRTDNEFQRVVQLPTKGPITLPVGEYDLLVDNDVLGLKAREVVRVTRDQRVDLNLTLKP